MTKRNQLKESFQYEVDKLLSKGTRSLIFFLILASMLIVILASFLGLVLNSEWSGGSVFQSVWKTAMFVLDSGRLSELSDDVVIMTLMTLVTIAGIFIVSALVGIISSGLEARFTDLRKGKSKIIEMNHTVILGYNEKVLTLVDEIIQANLNKKKGCIVVLGTLDKQEMEDDVRGRLKTFKNTLVHFRSGSSSDLYNLDKCSIQTARSIIINEDSDLLTIKSLIAVVNMLDNLPDTAVKPHISTIIYEKSNLEVARVAGKSYTEILHFKSAIGRIIAHTFYQPGISKVFTELFDFKGDEIYVEEIPGLVGRTFYEAQKLFKKSSVIGIKRDAGVLLNPSKGEIFLEHDKVILIAEDDNISKLSKPEFSMNSQVFNDFRSVQRGAKLEKLLIIGSNDLLSEILCELDNYLNPGSSVTIADYSDDYYTSQNCQSKMRNLQTSFLKVNTGESEELRKLLSNCYDHILVLSDRRVDCETADSMTLFILIHIRDLFKRLNYVSSITSEMNSIRNQILATSADVSDFVISNNITSLMLSKISEDRTLSPIFDSLLCSEGNEIYLRYASDYVKTGIEVSIYEMVEYFAANNEIFLGYRKACPLRRYSEFDVRINLLKDEKVIFSAEDMIIVLANQY
jgi:ion channel POLLUX/CASTOR